MSQRFDEPSRQESADKNAPWVREYDPKRYQNPAERKALFQDMQWLEVELHDLEDRFEQLRKEHEKTCEDRVRYEEQLEAMHTASWHAFLFSSLALLLVGLGTNMAVKDPKDAFAWAILFLGTASHIIGYGIGSRKRRKLDGA
jgi:hypothetical protein